MCKIKLAGENSVIIYFGDHISPELIYRIVFYRDLIKRHLADVIIDVVPSYTTLLVSYRLKQCSHDEFIERISRLLTIEYQNQTDLNFSHVKIPVFYDSEVGLDLNDVLTATNLSLNELIQLHSSPEYLTYAIGFSPVFAFLGTLDQRLHLPRLATPRISIPAGSVAIANNQTAVYPVKSAGGWNIIGRTPLNLSLQDQANLHRFDLGYRVSFVPIDRQQFIGMGGVL